MQQVPEQQIIAPLIAKSRPFRKFYEAESPHLPPRRWLINPKIGMLDIDKGGPVSIWHGKSGDIHLPPPPHNPFMVAHELLHLRLHKDGYPQAKSDSSFMGQFLNRSLNSLFTDPLINKWLGRYGFNHRQAVQDEINYIQRAIKQLDLRNETPLENFLNALQYWSVVLDWRGATSGQSVGGFERWYSKKFPTVAAETALLEQRVKGFDLESKSGQFEALRLIQERYQELANGNN